jgi:hypothetical protein
MNGWITVDRLTLIDAQGRSHPLSAPSMWLSDATRWREVERFNTSRLSDRGTDQSAAGEIPYIILENLRALPRAWIVPDVTTLNDDDALEAVRIRNCPTGLPSTRGRWRS